MAVKIKFTSVTVLVQAIKERFRGGMDGFKESYGSPMTDGKLVRMGAMNPVDISFIVKTLEHRGMKGIHIQEGKETWLDFCIVDRCSGPTLPCKWIKVDLEKGEVELKRKC